MHQYGIICKDIDYSWLVLCCLSEYICPLFLLCFWRKNFSLWNLPALIFQKMHLNFSEESIFWVIWVRSPWTWVWGVGQEMMLRKHFPLFVLSQEGLHFLSFPWLWILYAYIFFLLGSLSDIVFRKNFIPVCQAAFLSWRLARWLKA